MHFRFNVIAKKKVFHLKGNTTVVKNLGCYKSLVDDIISFNAMKIPFLLVLDMY